MHKYSKFDTQENKLIFKFFLVLVYSIIPSFVKASAGELEDYVFKASF